MTHFVPLLPLYRAGSKTFSSAVTPTEPGKSSGTPELRPSAGAAVSLTVALRYLARRGTGEVTATVFWPALKPL
jgi:hypothetical protein